MPLAPFPPRGVVRRKFRKPSLEIFSLDPHQPAVVRVPERVCFPVDQDEGVPVGPPRGGERQRVPVDPAAVHSR